ncbi:MAG: TonB-dependent receptor [Gemmatimonadaceae bacterium]|nr:TonB-dependent receptor [Gemmatimonadaceae bacterium]
MIRLLHSRSVVAVGLLAATFLPSVLRAQGPTGTLTGTVTEAGTGKPISGATVFVLGTPRGMLTREDGTYRLTVRAGSYDVTARLVGFGSAKRRITIAAGQTLTENFTLDKSAVNLQAVAVVGTRRTERSVTDAPVPIDVVTSEQIKQTGRTELGQILQMIVPSLNFSRATVADGTDHQRPFTLRGLGPDQVLVLINGKRRHNGALVNINNSIGRGSAGVDLNAIPATSIDRIEVLRDGAAAQYGSDAIAGVVNVVLKSNAPLEASSTVGVTEKGDGQVTQADLARGFALGGSGFVHLSGEFRDRGFTNRSLPDLRPQYGDSISVANGAFVRSTNPRQNDPYRLNLINHRQGDAATQDAVAFLNAGKTFSNDVTLYAFGGLGRRKGEAAGFFRRAGDNRTVRALWPDGFLPLIRSTIVDRSLSVGLKGTNAGWKWDASSVYGYNGFRFDVANSNNASLGPLSPTNFYAGQLRFTQITNNIDLSRAVNVGLAAPLNVALGAENRIERYGIGQGEPDSWRDGGGLLKANGRSLFTPGDSLVRALPGAQVFPGFRPQDEKDEGRTAFAGYVDLETKLTPTWLVNVAARGEHFSDFGSAIIGKLASRYELGTTWSLRGAVSTGFRAPSLAQSFLSASSTNFIGNPPIPQEVVTLPVGSAAARALGATDLKPEKSQNLSLGATWTPAPSFTATLDAYRITINDRIVFSENLLGTQVASALSSLGYSASTAARYFTNAIDTRTNGMDLVFNYGTTLENGATLRTTWGTNWGRTFVTRIQDNPSQLAALNAKIFGRVEKNRIEETQPRLNSRLTVNYQKKALGFEVQHAYFGTVWLKQGAIVDNTGAPVPLTTTAQADQTLRGRWITDASVSYRFTKVTLTGGFDNLFNVYPDRNIAINSNSGIFQYSGFSPWGFNGRFTYVRLSYRL